MLLLAGALAAAAYFTAFAQGWAAVRIAVKPVPAACLALVAGRQAGLSARLIALGLALSAVADAAIEWSFVAGLAVFLLAHLAYAAGFTADERRARLGRLLPFAVYGLGMFWYLWPRLGDLAVPVVVYVAAIVGMMWRAAARGEAAGLAGALLFAASDTLIALDRFVAPIPGARYAIMALYWAGQLGIAVSAARAGSKAVRATAYGVPAIPPSVPRRGGPLSRALGALALKAMGWRVTGNLPDLPKFVIVVAPHTSNWDFVVGIVLKIGLGLRASFLGKRTLFWWPLGAWLRYMGGIPVDRSQPGGVVEGVVAQFRARAQLVLAVTPSGTRRRGAPWKTGFYNIAFGAGVPVVPVAFDYASRTAALEPPLVMSGDAEADMAAVKAAMAFARGRNP